MPPKKAAKKKASVAIYCVKCKKKTGTSGIVRRTAKNGTPMMQGACVICKTKKTTFTKG